MGAHVDVMWGMPGLPIPGDAAASIVAKGVERVDVVFNS